MIDLGYSSSLRLQRPLVFPAPREVTLGSDTTVSGGDYEIVINKSGNHTVYLPASPTPGRRVRITDGFGALNLTDYSFVIEPAGGDTIEGNAQFIMDFARMSIELEYSGIDDDWKLMDATALHVLRGGTGVAGFGETTAKTANDALTIDQSYQTFTNEGASGTVTLSLPTPAAGLEYSAAVVAAQSLILDAGGSVVIALGPGIESTAGGQISANDPGAFVTLKCLSATRWQAIAGGNGWSPS